MHSDLASADVSPAAVVSQDRASASNLEPTRVSDQQPRVSDQVGFWLPMISLWWREMVRFSRQRSRVVGYLGSPLIFWLVVGSGFGSTFRPGNDIGTPSYLEYFFPGTLLLIVLFTSIFGMMTVIEDRREGFLRSVIASPIPRSSLVSGKVLGSATLATLQGLFFLLLAPLVGIHLSLGEFLLTAIVLFLTAISLTNLGFLIAWRLDSTHGFHGLVNLLLMPMWLVSGAVFPASGAASWIHWIMRLNPLTYILTALRRSLYFQSPSHVSATPSLLTALSITVAFGAATFWAALRVVNKLKARDEM